MWFNPERNIKASTHSEIRSACPQVSFPANMTDENIAEVGFVPYIESEEDAKARQVEQNNQRIKVEIAVLDLKRIRPLAEGDTAFLAELNAQIAALRGNLQK